MYSIVLSWFYLDCSLCECQSGALGAGRAPGCDKKSALHTDCKRCKASLSLAPSSLMLYLLCSWLVRLLASLFEGNLHSEARTSKMCQESCSSSSQKLEIQRWQKKKGLGLVFPFTNHFSKNSGFKNIQQTKTRAQKSLMALAVLAVTRSVSLLSAQFPGAAELQTLVWELWVKQFSPCGTMQLTLRFCRRFFIDLLETRWGF